MKTNLQFDFLADRENISIIVKREFAANRQLVWDCHTKSEILEQWFAPKPFTAKTGSMDFSEGGHWHYAMVSPEGKEYWGWTDYIKIQPIDFYDTRDAFSDAEGNIDPNLPRAKWHVRFSDMGNHTLVETTVIYDSLEDLDTVIKMGMEEGLTATLKQLDEFLNTLNN